MGNDAAVVAAVIPAAFDVCPAIPGQQLHDSLPLLPADLQHQCPAGAQRVTVVLRKGPVEHKAEEAAAPAEGTKEPVVKAPARSSESELDIMVED